jgi:uncharacterized protein (TIGR03435 family)
MSAGYRNATMEMLAHSLSVLNLGRMAVDQTGLRGRFDYTIEWAPGVSAPPPSAESDTPAPSALEALRDQLGLRAEAAKGPVRVLVIDKVERPLGN